MKILSKFFFIFLSLVIPFSLCSFKNKDVENFNETEVYSNQSIYTLDELFEKDLRNSQMTKNDIQAMYNALIDSTNVCYGDKWREGMIEHRVVVDFDENSVAFNQEKIVGQDTEYFNIDAATKIVYENKTKFGSSTVISTEKNIKSRGESTVAFGAKFPGAKLNIDATMQGSYEYNQKTEYSTEFLKESSYKITYDPTKINVPDNCSVAIGVVGDYLEFKAHVYEEKYYWWGTYIQEDFGFINCRIYPFAYKTFIFSDGTHAAKTARPY